MARLNENENENENESIGGGGGLYAGARFNTYKIARQAYGTVVRSAKIPGYDQMAGWDAENKGWVYITEFAGLRPAWFAELHAVAKAEWSGWNPGAASGAKDSLDSALLDIADAAGEREDRFAEILHQRDADGCIRYWISMLGIDPVRQPNTNQLIRVARKLGEMVVMCLKAKFNAARPSQLSPALVPMIEPPRTASFPAGHSLQSYLTAYLLLRVMSKLPGTSGSPFTPPANWTVLHEGFFALARRIADNRVIAGIHFDIDNSAGFLIAQKLDEWFGVWLTRWRNEPNPAARAAAFPEFSNLGALLDAAANEFPQFN